MRGASQRIFNAILYPYLYSPYTLWIVSMHNEENGDVDDHVHCEDSLLVLLAKNPKK